MDLLNLFFPKRCAGCGRFGTYICNRCRSSQLLHTVNICPACERPSFEGYTHPRCKTKLSLDGATFIFEYKPPISNLIKQLKYKFGRDLSDVIVSWTTRELGKLHIPKKDFTLVPIPLHTIRHNWRGFNQADVLGEAISKRMGWKFSNNALVRSGLRRPQTEVKKADKRRSNVRGIFSINPNIPITQYPNVLLFDDVWTTGATVKEAAKVLKWAGARFVWGLTIAR